MTEQSNVIQYRPTEQEIEVFNAHTAKSKPIVAAIRNLLDAAALLELMRDADTLGHDIPTDQLSSVLDVVIPMIKKALRKLDRYGIDDMQRELKRAGLQGQA